MIWTVMQISLRRLMHNRIELLLTFVVPIAFFSIFALIFGKGIGSGTTPKVKVVLVDEIASQESDEIAQTLRGSAGLRFMDNMETEVGLTREQATEMVRSGSATIGIVLTESGESYAADLLADASDQVAGQVVSALVGREIVVHEAKKAAKSRQLANMQQAPADGEALLEAAFEADERAVVDTASNETTRQAIVRRPSIEVQPETAAVSEEEDSEGAFDVQSKMDGVKIVDVIGEGKANPVVSMYAAGIAVMFLLFGATGGGGALLEERENTTLDRLLSTQLSMDQLLLGKWFYLTVLGFVQVLVMFIWGQIVFGVDLVGHIDGFVMMTFVTSGAAAAFGLCLATLCKTRGQLNGLSVILILTMSALGGSMVPRYVMSERMREMGLWTFNAWALDGYDKVFWRDLPVGTLWPQLSVLMFSGVGLLLVARALAIRWEFD